MCVTAAALICTEGSTCVWGSCETSDTSFLQVQKIISHFQALLFSHSGCLFFTKARRIEVDNKPSICQSENEFLNAERHFGILKSICHRQNILSLTLFLRCRFPLQPLKHKHCGQCKSIELQLRESRFHSLFLCCCRIAVQWGLLNVPLSQLTLS